MLGNRRLKQVLKAFVGRQHYIALVNMYRHYPEWRDNFLRYLTGGGHYPYHIQVKTPAGMICPTLYSHHDLLTVNEIFCRLDYFASDDIKTIVDLGSNIGISALYFLTRNTASKCYLYEPDLRNVEKLRKNLVGFEDRYHLSVKAVSYEDGEVEFGIEATGRYGGIGLKTGKHIRVDCVHINGVMESILEKEERIDILKIDTEGVETETVNAIGVKHLSRIKKIYLEANPTYELRPELFKQMQYGSVCQLVNRNI